MKYLVVLCLAVACCRAGPVSKPIEADYELPRAQPIVIPASPVHTAPLVARVVPLAPAPVRVLSQSLTPVPVPAPVARVASPFVPQPLPVPVVNPVAVAQAPIPVVNHVPVAAQAPIPVVNTIPVAPQPAPVIDVAPSSQFHAQDELGGFSFGYANGQSAKQEVRTPDGVTRGRYSYIDANGETQVVEYVSDPVNGFRVAGTNIPVAGDAQVVAVAEPVMDTPEVAAAKADFAKAFEAEVVRQAALNAEEEVAASRKKRSPIEATYGLPAAGVVQVVEPVQQVTIPEAPFVEPPPAPAVRFVAAAPAFPRVIATPSAVPLLASHPLRTVTPVAVAPVAVPNSQFNHVPIPVAQAPIPVVDHVPVAAQAPTPVVNTIPVAPQPAPVIDAAPSSQFHAQDELGGFSFGYQNAQSARHETRTPDGVTQGSYSYIDANGETQVVQYIADAVNGFRVVGTNLPVAPVA